MSAIWRARLALRARIVYSASRHQRGHRQHDAEREHRLVRDGRGQPDPDRRSHHLPEAEQRRGRAGLLAERRQRLRGAERIDDAHAEQEHAAWPPRNGRKAASNSDTSRIAMLPAAAASRPPWIERSSPKRGASLVDSMPAANTIITVPAKNRPSWIGVKCRSFDQDARRGRKHREQPAHDQADGRGRHQEAAIGDQAEIVFGDRQRIERDPRRAMGFAEHRDHRRGRRRRRKRRQRRIRSASRNNDRARRRAAARSRARPPSRS